MTTLTMRVDDVDASVVRKYAKFEGKTISDFIRDAVFEKIEDQAWAERYVVTEYAKLINRLKETALVA